MAKPCAVFWDIQNVGIPKGQSANSIIKLIRSTIIKPYNLNQIFFYCVCDVNKLPRNIGQSLTTLDVEIVQAYNNVKDSADMKILDLMRQFVKLAGQGCTIILISGDADYYGTLDDLKKLHNVSIHLIRLANSFSSKLDKIADYIFILNNSTLKPIKTSGPPMYFISIKRYPLTMNITHVIAALNSQIAESIQKSSILFDGSICIGFPTLWNAERAVKKFNGSRFHGHFLKVKLIVDSPLADILKCIMPGITVPSKSTKEVKQLTFIKINNSNRTVNNSKIIEFCNALYGHQCILSRNSFLWIVFNFKSAAENCLSKVKIMYPDAIISEPPTDLTLTCPKNQYTVESCNQKFTKKSRSGVNTSNVVKSAPENVTQASLQNQGFHDLHYTNNINPSVDIEPKSSMQTEEQNIGFDLNANDNWNIFFHLDNYFVSSMLPDKPSKWSLLYNLFEKLYDLGAKKVVFDGNLYCAHFDSVAAYQNAFEEKRSRYFKPLESIYANDRSQRIAKILDQYVLGIPWCLNEQLDLHCLVVKIDSQFFNKFLEVSRNILGNRGCIFIKPVLAEIWIGFPDELLCKNSKIIVYRLLASIKQLNDVTIDKPTNKLLESINFSDLVGDAYDIAFLSSHLEPLQPIAKPLIIERIGHQRSEECNDSVFHITVNGNFRNWLSWNKLSLEQIVKVLVNLSKVIPLAATASFDEVNLIYKSWYEAHAARHFINNLTPSEVPYFTYFQRASDFKQQPSALCSILKYYLVNDKRNILEKILQNKSLIDRLNSVELQSKPDNCTFDEEMGNKRLRKIQRLFVITTDSKFKLTSGMIAIVEMHLAQMGCLMYAEFEDTIWVGTDDPEKGDKAKAKIEQIKFKVLHEKDEDDFEVGIVMKSAPSCPTNVSKLLANKSMDSTKATPVNTSLIPNAVPLGHFNYNYRKAVRMSIIRYCQINAADGS